MSLQAGKKHRLSALRSPDAILGLTLLACVVVFLLYTLPMSAEAAAWPWAVLTILAALGAAIAVRGLRAARTTSAGQDDDGVPSSSEWSRATLRRPALTVLIVTIYVALLSVIGFFPATALYLCGHLWFGGVRDWRVYAGVTVVLCGLIYLLFVAQLSVPLPTGLLFG